jgi:hypothetical protein
VPHAFAQESKAIFVDVEESVKQIAIKPISEKITMECEENVFEVVSMDASAEVYDRDHDNEDPFCEELLAIVEESTVDIENSEDILICGKKRTSKTNV